MHDRPYKRIRPYGVAAALCAALLLATALLGVAGAAQAQTPPAAGGDAALIEQGKYLATAGDCISCHTRPNGQPFSGGLPLKTPFGTIYSANITPDADAGIGNWTEQQLARAMREGVADDGSHLYPAFPYTAYTKVTDADVHAIYAYLKSLQPVKYTPPKNDMPFPFGIRGLMMAWNKLYLKEGRYTPDAAQSPEWNRGAYLVQGLGHCGACHTPRGSLGGEKADLALTGGTYVDGIVDEVEEDKIVPVDGQVIRPWSAVNLTSAPSGLGAWSVEEIETYLKTGHNKRAGAFGPMSEVVANSTQHLTDPDLHAMAVYLKSLPPTNSDTGSKPTQEQTNKGEIVYTVRCGDCHLPTGLGIPQDSESAEKRSPPLVGNAVVQAPDPATLINVILYGAHEANPADPKAWPKMSGFELGVGLDDEQIADLCNYLRSALGNQGSAVDAKAVAKQR